MREELAVAREVIRNTSKTVQAFRKKTLHEAQS
jgi:hypothetical protein